MQQRRVAMQMFFHQLKPVLSQTQIHLQEKIQIQHILANLFQYGSNCQLPMSEQSGKVSH